MPAEARVCPAASVLKELSSPRVASAVVVLSLLALVVVVVEVEVVVILSFLVLFQIQLPV